MSIDTFCIKDKNIVVKFPQNAYLWIPAICAVIHSAAAASPPPEMSAPFTKAPFVIDGRLDESFWNESASTKLPVIKTDTPPQAEETVIRMTTTPEGLLIAIEAEDHQRVTQERPKDDNTYFDDCVEVFLTLPVDKPEESMGLEISANGTVADFLYRPVGWVNRGWGCRGLQVASQQNDQSFIVEIFIPWTGFPREWKVTTAPERLRANFARWNRPGKNFSIWSDPQAPYPDPHRIDSYGWLNLQRASTASTN